VKSGSVLLIASVSKVLTENLSLVFPQLEMRSQDQALIQQLMKLHVGIQELKAEQDACALYDLDDDDDDDELFYDSDVDTDSSHSDSECYRSSKYTKISAGKKSRRVNRSFSVS